MKKLFLFAALVASITLNAQVTKVQLKASGLTCSMCSNAINKALKTLDFVENINADIKTYTFDISFKANSKVDFDKIKKKVEGAGFSITSFTAFVNFNHLVVKNMESVVIDDQSLVFVTTDERLLNGVMAVQLLDKGFVSKKEYKKTNLPALLPGTYHVNI
ncbi:MAG: heavy-metal-associated domain-containing protein [Ferruginibacter sp.]